MSTQSSQADNPLVAARRDFLESFKTRDIDKIVSLADPDTVWMPPNDTSLYGPDEVRDWLKEYFEYFRVTSITEPDREVTMSGELAIEQTSYMAVITPLKGGTRIRDDGRMVTIWRPQPDSSWKIWRLLWNSTRPVGSGTNRFMSRMLQKRSRAN